MPKTTGQNAQPEEESVAATDTSLQMFEEIPDLGFDASYSSRISEFLVKSSLTMNDAVFYLYKYENYGTGDSKACIKKYTDGEPPDEHEVGMAYGSGRYLLIMYVPPSNGRKQISRGYKFRCHQNYDTVRNVAPVSVPSVVSPAPVNPGQSMLEVMGMFTALINALGPLIRPPTDPDVSKMSGQYTAMFQDVMKKAMMSNIELMNNYQHAVAKIKNPGDNVQNRNNQNDQQEGDGGSAAGIIEQLAPFITEWLPKLIAGGQQGKAVAMVAKSTKMFQEIKRNRNTITALIRYLEEKNGPEDTNKVLTALSLKRPPAHQRKT